MQAVRIALLLAGCVLALAAQSREARIARGVAARRDQRVAQRRDFHMYPELSNREERTARVIAEELRRLGFDEVRTGVSRHGVVGLLKGGRPGPVVAVRADMDALPVQETLDVPYRSRNPGVKHACGHDVHMTVALGAARLLSGMKQELAGSVKFIFQPAEEGPPEGEQSGAAQMIREGALEQPRPGAIFALHTSPLLPAGKVGYAPGPMLASSDSFSIRIIGKKVHAAWPHQGIDPVVVAAECIGALQTISSRRLDPVEPVVITVGSIHGGNRNNIIADEVKMEGTLRTHNEAVRERAMTLMKEVLGGVAAAHGARAEITWSEKHYPVTVNDTALIEKTLPALRAALGAENVVRVPPVMGGEDFSFYQKVIPGCMFWLGVANPARGITAMLHTAEFDVDEESLLAGVRVMTAVLLDYLEQSR
ncbi:MAG: amidohydrolase [Bryobacterales bacterium]|nr:amidohydrolase [Bryobacterales bacterium]